MPAESYNQVVIQINDLHKCTCEGSYKLLLQKTLSSWKKFEAFKNYFTKVWINSPFCNWQIFIKPPGFSGSNSPIESYNNQTKSQFTNRLSYHMIPALEVFKEQINYESENKIKFMVNKFTQALLNTGLYLFIFQEYN